MFSQQALDEELTVQQSSHTRPDRTAERRLRKQIKAEQAAATQRQITANWPNAVIERVDTGKVFRPIREIGLVLICGFPFSLPLAHNHNAYGCWLSTDGDLYQVNSTMWTMPHPGMAPYRRADRQYDCLNLTRLQELLEGLKAL